MRKTNFMIAHSQSKLRGHSIVNLKAAGPLVTSRAIQQEVLSSKEEAKENVAVPPAEPGDRLGGNYSARLTAAFPGFGIGSYMAANWRSSPLGSFAHNWPHSDDLGSGKISSRPSAIPFSMFSAATRTLVLGISRSRAMSVSIGPG